MSWQDSATGTLMLTLQFSDHTVTKIWQKNTTILQAAALPHTMSTISLKRANAGGTQSSAQQGAAPVKEVLAIAQRVAFSHRSHHGTELASN